MQDEEDVKIEAEDSEQSEGQEDKAENKIAKIREELATCRREKQEYMDGWQRAKADYVNALKRFESDLKAAGERGKVYAVETLLPAFDALERAKEHGEVPSGFMAIAKQLEGAFARLGLIELGRIGETFDPAIHEALGQDTAETLETDNTLTVVLEKGWKVGETVVRPAKVRVGHFISQ